MGAATMEWIVFAVMKTIPIKRIGCPLHSSPQLSASNNSISIVSVSLRLSRILVAFDCHRLHSLFPMPLPAKWEASRLRSCAAFVAAKWVSSLAPTKHRPYAVSMKTSEREKNTFPSCNFLTFNSSTGRRRSWWRQRRWRKLLIFIWIKEKLFPVGGAATSTLETKSFAPFYMPTHHASQRWQCTFRSPMVGRIAATGKLFRAVFIIWCEQYLIASLASARWEISTTKFFSVVYEPEESTIEYANMHINALRVHRRSDIYKFSFSLITDFSSANHPPSPPHPSPPHPSPPPRLPLSLALSPGDRHRRAFRNFHILYFSSNFRLCRHV